jgi:hypothetical protein
MPVTAVAALAFLRGAILLRYSLIPALPDHLFDLS